MLHRVDELLCTEDIDVEMVSALSEVAVHHVDEIVRAFVKRVAERIGADRLGVGNAVKRILVGELCYGIERGEQTALLCAVAWVGAGRKRRAGFAAVGERSCSFAVHHVGRDRENRGRRFGMTVGRVAADAGEKLLEEPHCKLVRTIVVVAVTREVAFRFIVHHHTGLIADRFHAGVLDRTE